MFRDISRLGRMAGLLGFGLVGVGVSLSACDGGGGSSNASGAPDAAAGGPGGSPATGGTPGGGSGGSGPGGAGGDGGSPAPANFEATRANLRFKGAARLREDFARILRLPTDALCTELGRFDCVDEIHQISLGGVEPYRANIFVPFPGVAVGAPLAVERVALSACGERVRRDFESPETAVFFGRLPLEGGALTTVDSPAVDAALTRLFHEALLREPTREDLTVLKGLYADTVAEGVDTPARTWAQLVCLSVLTTTEALLF